MTSALTDRVTGQRWYGAKSRTIVGSEVLDTITVQPQLALELVELTYDTGLRDVYQLFSGEETDVAPELVSAMRSSSTVQGSHGVASFQATGDFAGVGAARLNFGEQSNSSVVLGEELILKVFRRIEPGVNPELEMLRFLAARGFANVPALRGWYEYSGVPLSATLGVLQEFVPDAVDGWQFALDNPEQFLDRLGRLGRVTAELHTVLGSELGDPAFRPEDASVEAPDEEVAGVFASLPDDTRLAPIAGRGEEVRARLRHLTDAGSLGRAIRTHGDFHLGQTLVRGDDWLILDFEGEPARTIAERRRKRSPLRDVAGMLRSFGYAASVAAAPAGWEEQARTRFLDSYLAAVEPSLLPSSEAAIERLLAVFELEKAVYELRYELDNRPDWVPIPVAAIDRLLNG